MPDNEVTIPKEEYFELKLAEAKLEFLYSGGVDNWDWYEGSLLGFSEVEKELRKEILGEEKTDG